jgi:hypothetical protein
MMSHADHSLYIIPTCDYIVIVNMYVDDLIVLANNSDIINELKFNLKHEFKMSDLGKLYLFFIVHFERDRRTCTIIIHQHSYIKSILECFGMRIANPLESRSMRRHRWRSLRRRSTKIFCLNERYSVSKCDGVINVCNGGHKSRPHICDKRGKSIYAETGSNALDGHEENHVILEGHLRYEIAHWRQIYKPKNLFQCELGQGCEKS